MTYVNPNQHPENTKRAERLLAAAATVEYYGVGEYQAVEEVAQDILTDLMHLCDRFDLNLGEIHRRARNNYLQEVAEPEI